VTARLRTAITLAVLAVLLVGGVAWGFGQVVKPFPGKVDLPQCVPTDYTAGEEITPADVTVSVLNGSSREGLAGRTQQLFEEAGFPQGQVSNAPDGTKVKNPLGELWVSDRSNPAIALVRTRIGKVPVREVSDLPVVGIVFVVGDQFDQLTTTGLASVTLDDDATICSPPA
jgi:hypothetical protein